MGWETRGGRAYYYAARRVNGKVVKEYVGGGDLGDMMALLALLEQDRRAATAAAFDEARVNLDRLAAALAPLDEWADALAAGVMLAAGYHRPRRGAWRKRRG